LPAEFSAVTFFAPTANIIFDMNILDLQQAARRLATLPPHLANMAEFTLATGLRARNVRELVWSQVDLSRQIAWPYADQFKNNTDLTLPLNTTAIAVIRRRIGSHDTHVFSYRGKPLRNINADAGNIITISLCCAGQTDEQKQEVNT
jgi:integrase